MAVQTLFAVFQVIIVAVVAVHITAGMVEVKAQFPVGQTIFRLLMA